MKKETDFLVIGSGIAGLSYALKVADTGRVLIVTKGEMHESNTEYAQGGICCVTYPPDNFEKHIQDTLICGAGLCDPVAVELVVTRAPEAIRDLVRAGVRFDKTPAGKYDLAREGGHSENRILHHKDYTGAEIERALISRVKKHPNIEILEHHFAVDIITQHHLGRLVTKQSTDITCYGAYVLNLKTSGIVKVLSRITVLSTGGVGNIYHTTTNPPVATGDGIAMVHRAKGVTENMEFIQFHPTSLYNPGERPSFLISEALRGFGAILRLSDGREFMHKYHPMGSLAPRDIVARSIDHELKTRGEDFVYLDITSRNPEEVIAHFPHIYEKCLSIGIDITKEMIPVVPAAHYCCGGVKVDYNGQSSIANLYALGETSSTGLHGANRLASNSLIEAAVYADLAAAHSAPRLCCIPLQMGIPDWNDEGTSSPEEMVLITQNYREMQQIMSNYVGIVRSNLRLERAMRRLEIIFQETEELYLKSTLSQNLCELRNMITVGYLIIKQAQQLKQSVGLHYSLDYPLTNAVEM
ncbi:MAG: L-aspartate oxidase [Alistipes sp.]|nr:L-aspartate oxidase [Alistipes sp.]